MIGPARRIVNGTHGATIHVFALERDGAVCVSFRDFEGHRAMIDVTPDACDALAAALRVAAAEVRAASKKV